VDRRLIFNGQTPFTTIGATDDPNDPPFSCGLGLTDVWYNYIPSFDGLVTIDTCRNTTFDTIIEVYDGCLCPPDPATVIACNDDALPPSPCAGTFLSSVTFPVIAGNCYKVRVGGVKGARGDGTITITKPPAPSNSACIDRVPIFDGATPYDTTGATTDGPGHGPLCQFDGQTYHDIWYNYTASCTGTLTVSTCLQDGGDAFYDSDLAVYNGCACPVSDAVLLGCNDDFGAGCTATGTSFPSRVVVPVNGGDCYKIRVGGFEAGHAGPGILSVNCVP
jgi:hypothetical protein